MDYLIRNYIDDTKVRAIPYYYSELNHRRQLFRILAAMLASGSAARAFSKCCSA